MQSMCARRHDSDQVGVLTSSHLSVPTRATARRSSLLSSSFQAPDLRLVAAGGGALECAKGGPLAPMLAPDDLRSETADRSCSPPSQASVPSDCPACVLDDIRPAAWPLRASGPAPPLPSAFPRGRRRSLRGLEATPADAIEAEDCWDRDISPVVRIVATGRSPVVDAPGREGGATVADFLIEAARTCIGGSLGLNCAGDG